MNGNYTEEVIGTMIRRTYDNGAIVEFPDPAQLPPEPPQPTDTTVHTKLQFLDLFTIEEMAAYVSAAKQDPVIEAIKLRLDAASAIDMADPRTIEGVNALEQAGVLGPGRAAEILAHTIPL